MLDINQIENFLNQKLTKEEKNKIMSLEERPIVKNYDLSGQIFTRLLVLGKAPSEVSSGNKKTGRWWCICQCPKHTICCVRTNNLKSGNTKSCGCLCMEKSRDRIIEIGHNMAKDITNQVFGELTALEPTSERRNGSILWKCKCSCGKIHYASGVELRAKRIRSCGHPIESSGIRKIKKILEENQILYITEKTFSTCKFKDTHASARFDFYLPKYNILIEFDGEQHFKEKDLNYFRDSLEKRQEHDAFKTEWCNENNIKLIRIPYYLEDNLTIEMLLGTKERN